jgi:2-oxoglutarate ferredoxin oxidoreductase subunit alpha
MDLATQEEEQIRTAAQRQLVSGNRLVALGAVAAGCRFFSGYPITPSSEIFQTMIEELPRPGNAGLALAAPDEISALAYCVGASMAGYKAMTATSGPGWCLMIETLQYAVITETPVVIAVVQRLGPSTGGATQGAQGDVLLTQFCTSGGYTIPVFAPSNARECFELTQTAFWWSERLRTPVVLLSDKEVGMTLESVDGESLQRRPAAERAVFSGGGRYLPYEYQRPDEPPAFAPVGGAVKVVATGSAHDREGKLRKNSAEVIDLLTHLQTKIAAHAKQMAICEADLPEEAETLVLSYGTTARAAREAVNRLRAAGHKVSFLKLMTLFPIATDAIVRAAKGCRRVVVAEENLTGLYASMVQSLVGERELVRVNGIGNQISPARIVEAVERAR